MNRNTILFLLFAGLIIFLIDGYSISQESGTTEMVEPCSKCHTCPNPTPDNPCLPVCARHAIEALRQQERTALEQIEETITIDSLLDMYEPVYFSHKGHAEMSLMGRGCTSCHHHTPPGRDHPSCASCHDPESNKEHLRIPSLKAAYHQQCLTCHVEWGGTKDCDVCHPVKGSEMAEAVKRGEKTFEFPRKEPEDILTFKISYEGKPADVPFDHSLHADVFGFNCADCHAQTSCGSCHNPKTYGIPTTVKEHPYHSSCGDCHDVGECGKCHPGAGSARNFNHASTGLPLLKYHVKLDCTRCHRGSGHYTKLNKECTNCHSGWTMDNFSHSIIGLDLDEIHSYFDCTDCHEERQYDKPVLCAHCHDETYRYPAKIPGTRVTPKY